MVRGRRTIFNHVHTSGVEQKLCGFAGLSIIRNLQHEKT